MVAISFQPTDTPMIVNGELTFGGTDTSKITGTITFAYVMLSSAIQYVVRRSPLPLVL